MFRPKIAREVLDSKHRKLRERCTNIFFMFLGHGAYRKLYREQIAQLIYLIHNYVFIFPEKTNLLNKCDFRSEIL